MIEMLHKVAATRACYNVQSSPVRKYDSMTAIACDPGVVGGGAAPTGSASVPPVYGPARALLTVPVPGDR